MQVEHIANYDNWKLSDGIKEADNRTCYKCGDEIDMSVYKDEEGYLCEYCLHSKYELKGEE